MVTILGWIRNSSDHQPIAGARVRGSCSGTLLFTVSSDTKGRFQYRAQNKTDEGITIRVDKEGFIDAVASVNVRYGEAKIDILLEKKLSVSPPALKPPPPPAAPPRPLPPPATPRLLQISGIVRNRKNKRAIDDAAVTFSIGARELGRANSDSRGRFSFSVRLVHEEAQHGVAIGVERPGFKKVQIIRPPSDRLDLNDLELTPVRTWWRAIAAAVAAAILASFVAYLLIPHGNNEDQRRVASPSKEQPADRGPIVLPPPPDREERPAAETVPGAEPEPLISQVAPKGASKTPSAELETGAGEPFPSARPEAQSSFASRFPSGVLEPGRDAVARMQLTTRMQGLEPGPPIDSPLRLPPGQTRMIYFFTELRGLSSRPVVHQWERNGRVVKRRELYPRSQLWRGYSGMTVTSGMQGNWRVAVIDVETGTLMTETRFEVE